MLASHLFFALAILCLGALAYLAILGVQEHRKEQQRKADRDWLDAMRRAVRS